MEEKIRKLQYAMNDYLVRTHATESIIYENLNLLYHSACYIEKSLYSQFRLYQELPNYSKIAKVTLMDKFNIMQNFYQMMGISFDFNHFINDGTIELVYYDYFYDHDDPESIKFHHLVQGNNTYENAKKIVNITNTGFITDVLIAVHEMSHLRDQPEEKRNQISDLFTEALAYTEELIGIDYLSKIGYQEEMKFWKRMLFHTFYYLAHKTRPIYQLFLLHQTLGDISKASYQYYFHTEAEYEKLIDYMSKWSETQSFPLYSQSWYIMGATLAPFMYTEYQKDHHFAQNILELHQLINLSDPLTCLKKMGLHDFNREDRIKVAQSLEIIKKELKATEKKKKFHLSSK